MKLSHPLEVVCSITRRTNRCVVIDYFRKCEIWKRIELKRNDDSSISIRQIGGGDGPIVLDEDILTTALKMLS